MCVIPPVWGGTHEYIIQKKDSSFFCLNDLPAIIINGFHNVIRTNQITAATAQQLRDRERSRNSNKRTELGIKNLRVLLCHSHSSVDPRHTHTFAQIGLRVDFRKWKVKYAKNFSIYLLHHCTILIILYY